MTQVAPQHCCPGWKRYEEEEPAIADGRRSSVSGICRETRFYAGAEALRLLTRQDNARVYRPEVCAVVCAPFSRLLPEAALLQRHDKRARTQSPRESTVAPA